MKGRNNKVRRKRPKERENRKKGEKRRKEQNKYISWVCSLNCKKTVSRPTWNITGDSVVWEGQLEYRNVHFRHKGAPSERFPQNQRNKWRAAYTVKQGIHRGRVYVVLNNPKVQYQSRVVSLR